MIYPNNDKNMKYEEIFARSFSRHDQKRFRFGALLACFVVLWCMCTVFKPYLGTLPAAHLEVEKTTLICNTSKQRYDTCEMKGDVRIQGNSSTIFVFSSHIANYSTTIKPYARKGDKDAMETVTTFTIKATQEPETMLKCSKTHNVPAIVFSLGGYAGNNFHAFSDVILPLYATSREFNREVKFVVTNTHSSWTIKFQELLHKLSRYEIIDIDQENEVNCFPSVVVGLGKEDRKELHIESIKDFTRFLRSSYSLARSTAVNLTNTSTKKLPRLLIISRSKTRAFVNVKDVVQAAQDSGFEVIVREMNANLTRVSRLVNSCDVIMGVHGAGLTNMVFLPENGVLVQVVPWGKMDWLANTYFGEPSKAMGLKYLEYKISQEETTLIDQYPLNHEVLVDPFSIQRKGWNVYRSIYLEKQNVTLNITRFKETLSRALELLHS